MLRLFFREKSGSAAVEMALVTPLLMILMFGSFELGNYYLDNHVVVKAVRDGARYASRQAFTKFTCPSTVDATVAGNIRNVTRIGNIAGTGTPRLPSWTDGTITVSVRCVSNTANTYSGIYDDFPNVMIVKVNATVPYASLFKVIGFNSATININASSEAAVMGI